MKNILPILTGAAGLLAAGYLFLCAKDRYVSEAQFSVVVEEQSGIDMAEGLGALLGGASSGGSDTQAVIGFIQSADLLLEVEKQFGLVEHFSAPKRDWIFRMGVEDSLEDRLEYYRKKIAAQYNMTTGLVDLQVQSYSPELSLEVARYVLSATEAFINEQNQAIAQEQLEFAKSELVRAHEVVKTEEKALLNFQNTHNMIQPEALIAAQMEAIQALRLQKIQKEIEVATLKASSPKSPMLAALGRTVLELGAEIKRQEAALAGEDQQKLNTLHAAFKELELNLGFAVQLRKGAEILLESARADASSNSRFFSVIQNPYLPEEEVAPRRWYLLLSTIFLTLLSVVMVQALIKSVLDRSS